MIRLAPVLLLLGACACARPAAPEIFVAASLSDLVEAAAAGWGETVWIHSGGSSTLRAQIDRGAPADLLIAADRSSVEGIGEPPVPLWANELVIIVPADAPADVLRNPADLRGRPCVALADPELAPAGRYAREALRELGLWDEVEPVATGMPDVRAALAQVARRACDVGIVYRTDAVSAPSVRVTRTLETPTPVTYWAGVPENARHRDAALSFLSYLRGHEGEALAVRAGLRPAGPAR